MSTPGHLTATTPGETGAEQQEQEFDWLLDFISSFLRSPTWTTPLNNFIDEHCGEFSTEDENKLIYTTIHNEFVELVERVLSKNLRDIGISDEQFVAAVASGSSSGDAMQRLIFRQVLATEDFLTFRTMMTQRNAELEVESMRLLSTYAPSDQEEADLQLELALSISQAEAGDSAIAAKITAATFNEDDLAVALRLSMLDTERVQSEYEREQAELEHVLAMSLAAEAERLRLREAMEEMEKEAAAAAAAAAAVTKAAPVEAEAPKATAAAPAAAAAAAPAAAAPAVASAPAIPIVHGEPLPKKPLPPMSVKAPSSAAAPKSALPPIGGLPPISMGKLGVGASFSVPLSVEKAAHEENVRRAESAFAANKATLKEAKAASSSSSISPEELARRKEFMQRQRELLLKKKRAERDGDLEKYEAERASLEAAPSAPSVASAAAGPRALTDAEELQRKKDAMKGALVAHLKTVHADVEQKRAVTAASTVASVADQLVEMEKMRAAKASGLPAEQEQLKKQEAERKKLLQQMHANFANK